MAKILIVDDDATTRTLCAKAIAKLEHTTIEAHDGEMAWAILSDNPDIALIVTDYQMPRINGRELAFRMQGAPQLRDKPVIMISGKISVEEVRDLLGIGISRFLDKPIPVRTLQEYVHDLLDPYTARLAG